MLSSYFSDYGAVAIAALVATALVLFSFGMSYILAPRAKSAKKDLPYECGIEPALDMQWKQLNLRYYLFGILFLIFDVEAVFLFPWAVVFQHAAPVFYSMLLFIGILLFGLLYSWKKGVLQWK